MWINVVAGTAKGRRLLAEQVAGVDGTVRMGPILELAPTQPSKMAAPVGGGSLKLSNGVSASRDREANRNETSTAGFGNSETERRTPELRGTRSTLGDKLQALADLSSSAAAGSGKAGTFE
eukprot:2516437-Rhodomonas_salina.2